MRDILGVSSVGKVIVDQKIFPYHQGRVDTFVTVKFAK